MRVQVANSTGAVYVRIDGDHTTAAHHETQCTKCSFQTDTVTFSHTYGSGNISNFSSLSTMANSQTAQTQKDTMGSTDYLTGIHTYHHDTDTAWIYTLKVSSYTSGHTAPARTKTIGRKTVSVQSDDRGGTGMRRHERRDGCSRFQGSYSYSSQKPQNCRTEGQAHRHAEPAVDLMGGNALVVTWCNTEEASASVNPPLSAADGR